MSDWWDNFTSNQWLDVKPRFEGVWIPLPAKDPIEFPALIVGKINHYLIPSLLAELEGIFSTSLQNKTKIKMEVSYRLRTAITPCDKTFKVTLTYNLDQIIKIKKGPWNSYQIEFNDHSILFFRKSPDSLIEKKFHDHRKKNMTDVSKIKII